jgi:hypothetical protein
VKAQKLTDANDATGRLKMFKAIRAIFATPTEAGSVAGAVASGLDKAFFTQQESKDWTLKYLNATLPMNLSRRIIAMSITFVWVLSALLLLSLTIGAGLTESLAAAKTAQAVFEFMRDVLNIPFSLVMALYFGKGIATTLGKKE